MNYLIVVLDAFYAAKSSLYGFPEPTTPNIDEWARKGIVFDDATSQYTSTSTSAWSYLNGRYPYHSKDVSPMRDEDLPIGELFHQSGYRTGAFSDNPHISEGNGTDKGFDLFQYHLFRNDNNAETIRNRNEVSQRLFDNLFEWVQNGDSNPWFAYVHTLRPHSPYPPEEPYLSRFVDTSSVPPGQDAQEHFFNLERKFILSVFNTGWTAETDEQMVVMRRLYLANYTTDRCDARRVASSAGRRRPTGKYPGSDHVRSRGSLRRTQKIDITPERLTAK